MKDGAKMKKQLNEVFNLLDKWKELPAYKLEPRVDIFFGYYLPDIMEKHFGIKPDYIDKHKHIIPEFPLRDTNQTYRSKKVDFAVIGCKTAYLVELKTTNESIGIKQAGYLKLAYDKEYFKLLVEEVYDIRYSPKSDPKHRKLIERLYNVPEIGRVPFEKDDKNSFCEILPLLRCGSLKEESLDIIKRNIGINPSRKIEIVYILPIIPEEYRQDKNENQESITIGNLTAKVITFEKIRGYLTGKDLLSMRFRKLLRALEEEERMKEDKSKKKKANKT